MVVAEVKSLKSLDHFKEIVRVFAQQKLNLYACVCVCAKIAKG